MPLISKAFSDLITFTRTGSATYFAANGVLTTAANNEARFDYDPTTYIGRGILIEESRTNSIRNNTMVGAVAGTPGTLPTNWSVFTTLTGLTQTIVGTGVENGVTYIEIRLNGTPSAAGTYQWYTETANGVPATVGQTWTLSQFFKLQAGTLSGVSLVRHFFEERSSGGSYLTEQSITAPNPTAAALSTQRSSATRTLTDPACAFLRSGFNLALSGAAIDITLRIGLPQLELGAFATSVIPTVNAFALGVTRNADVASVNTLSPWYNASAGTLYVEGDAGGGNLPCFASIDDTTVNNRIQIRRATNDTLSGFRMVSSGGGVDVTILSGSAVGVNKVAAAFAASDQSAASNGALFTGITPITPIPTVTRLDIGAGVGSTLLNGYLRRITYYPRRLSNANLTTLTT